MCAGLALIIGIAQSVYAFAPATFSLVREFGASTAALSAGGAATGIFISATHVQRIAICAFLLQQRRSCACARASASPQKADHRAGKLIVSVVPLGPPY